MESSPGFPLPSARSSDRGPVDRPRDIPRRDHPVDDRREPDKGFDRVWNQAVGEKNRPFARSDPPSRNEEITSEILPGVALPVVSAASLPPDGSELPGWSAPPFAGGSPGLDGTGSIPAARGIPFASPEPGSRAAGWPAAGLYPLSAERSGLPSGPVQSVQERPAVPVLPLSVARTSPLVPPAGPAPLPNGVSAQGDASLRETTPVPESEGANRGFVKGPINAQAAEFAAFPGSGSAGRLGNGEGMKRKENFLTFDLQSVKISSADHGIANALGETRMRRPPENPTPASLFANRPTGLADGFAGSVFGLARGNGRPSPIGSGELDPARTERPGSGDRPLPAFPGGEISGSGPSVAASAASTVQGSRQADAVSVLETIQRLAEQAVTQGQNRLALTLRLEGGGSIRIRLVREGGEIHTLLNTDVPGLEALLRQHWSQFSQDSVDRGFRFQTLSFADPDGSPGNNRPPPDRGEEAASSFQDSSSTAGHLAAGSTQTTKRQEQTGQRPLSVTPGGSGRLRAWV